MTATVPAAQERDLLERAQGGSEDAFGRLVDAYRGELHAHCYRMLGSVHDAEDALQETLLRSWRAIGRFEGRSSLRSWLYTIATNTSLNAISKRPKRVLPIDYGPAADPHVGPGEPLVESVWVEPYADEQLGLQDGYAAPEARYEQREGVELAFVVHEARRARVAHRQARRAQLRARPPARGAGAHPRGGLGLPELLERQATPPGVSGGAAVDRARQGSARSAGGGFRASCYSSSPAPGHPAPSRREAAFATLEELVSFMKSGLRTRRHCRRPRSAESTESRAQTSCEGVPSL
jgi:RNA polymerase sigma factor (sigma-70 family)